MASAKSYPSSLLINVEELIRLQGVESQRVEFKKAWHNRKDTPRSTYWQVIHTITAFANDLYEISLEACVVLVRLSPKKSNSFNYYIEKNSFVANLIVLFTLSCQEIPWREDITKVRRRVKWVLRTAVTRRLKLHLKKWYSFSLQVILIHTGIYILFMRYPSQINPLNAMRRRN